MKKTAKISEDFNQKPARKYRMDEVGGYTQVNDFVLSDRLDDWMYGKGTTSKKSKPLF